jgi:hypothetical protein
MIKELNLVVFEIIINNRYIDKCMIEAYDMLTYKLKL